ncbi:hypothetical protein ACIA49_13090 [Kribbella sp. NPDC051587]|uniref:hypothetical protein n=1 Tax=Kribbella sp. NPDC051587 TaxID=3364119 RepID=UPI00379EA28B
MNIRWTLDRVIVLAVLVLSIAVTIADFSGALDSVQWLKDRIPVMTLLAMCLIASSFYFDGSRLQDAFSEASQKQRDEIVRALGADNVSIKIISQLQFRWKERETAVRAFLEECTAATDVASLLLEVERKQTKLMAGELEDGARTRFPWDVAVMVMDYTGRLLYHPNPAIINTRPNQPHHPLVLRERTGETFWANQFLTKKLKDALQVQTGAEYKVDRLTKVYFRQCRNVDAICIFESHLDVLYQLPS